MKEKIRRGWETECDWCNYPLYVGDDAYVDSELEILACSKTCLQLTQKHELELIEEYFPKRIQS